MIILSAIAFSSCGNDDNGLNIDSAKDINGKRIVVDQGTVEDEFPPYAGKWEWCFRVSISSSTIL